MNFTMNVLGSICIQLPLAPEMWQRCKALWTSRPNSVNPWLCSQMVAGGWHISRFLFSPHILVIYLAGNVTKKTLVGSHFPLLSPPVVFLSSLFFILPSLFPSLPHCSYLSSSLIVPSCVKLSVACSLGNWLTFALGYCSHLLPLKYLNRQNPTLHLRHGQISATTISQCPEYTTMRSAFIYVFNLFFPLSRVLVTSNKQQPCAYVRYFPYVTMPSVGAFVHVALHSFYLNNTHYFSLLCLGVQNVFCSRLHCDLLY